MELSNKFWSQVDKTSTCWNWTGYKNKKGYGLFHITKHKLVKVHRLSYEYFKGPIPPGEIVMHDNCDNPSCLNPAHLLTGTHQDNCDSRVRKGRSNTVRGEKAGGSKLTTADVISIRCRYALGESTIAELDREYGVKTCFYIVRRETWRHIPPIPEELFPFPRKRHTKSSKPKSSKPKSPKKLKSNPALFWSRVDKTDPSGCWDYRSSSWSIPSITVDGRPMSVNRYSYLLAHGSLPPSSPIVRTCNNRFCVNPAHLLIGLPYNGG